MIKSILRYPGSKGLAAARRAILGAFPFPYSEYRKPFVGGASILFSVPPSVPRWINDLNRQLVAVYTALKERPGEFIAACAALASDDPAVLRRQFDRMLRDRGGEIDEAVCYFFLNRCAFNGRVRLDDLWHRTFFSNPAGMRIVHTPRLTEAAALLRDVRITCVDFELLFDSPGRDVVIFADPPYVRDTELSPSAKLYEKGFSIDDHHRLSRCIVRCRHKVVLSYDDHDLVRKLYRGYRVTRASWTYTGNGKRPAGRELIITNFDPDVSRLAAAA